MKKIIKKNPGMVALIGGGLVLFLVLFGFALFPIIEMYQNIAATERMRDDIKKLNMQRNPSAAEANIPLLQQEQALYEEKFTNLMAHFGRIYYPALQAFSEKIHIEPVALTRKFEEFWGQIGSGNKSNTERIARGFFDYLQQDNTALTLAQWGEGLEAFRKAAQPNTLEPITDITVYEFFLASLGIPRNMQNTVFQQYIKASYERLGRYFESKGVSYVPITALSFGDSLLPNDQREKIPELIKSWEVIEDISRRVADSGVRGLDSIERATESRTEGDYTFYRFRIKLNGDLDNIRNFMNSLNEAFKNDRLYIIRTIAIEKRTDEAQEVLNVRRELSSDFGQDQSRQALEAKAALAMTPLVERPNYGVIEIGYSNWCKATVDVDYVTYGANELQ